MNGEGVTRNPKKAEDLFRQSAELFKQNAEKGDTDTHVLLCELVGAGDWRAERSKSCFGMVSPSCACRLPAGDRLVQAKRRRSVGCRVIFRAASCDDR